MQNNLHSQQMCYRKHSFLDTHFDRGTHDLENIRVSGRVKRKSLHLAWTWTKHVFATSGGQSAKQGKTCIGVKSSRDALQLYHYTENRHSASDLFWTSFRANGFWNFGACFKQVQNRIKWFSHFLNSHCACLPTENKCFHVQMFTLAGVPLSNHCKVQCLVVVLNFAGTVNKSLGCSLNSIGQDLKKVGHKTVAHPGCLKEILLLHWGEDFRHWLHTERSELESLHLTPHPMRHLN